jgi:hypothetical protein
MAKEDADDDQWRNTEEQKRCSDLAIAAGSFQSSSLPISTCFAKEAENTWATNTATMGQ